MGQKYLSGRGPDEMMLMPADPREWLPPGHLAWKVIELAAEMDLSGFGASYRGDGQGGRPHDPAMMATLILYCYCRGRKPAREIEAATHDDVGARIIAGGLHPDHSTVARFVARNEAAVRALLPESVKACAREGLADLSVVAGDGTKLKANAAMGATVTAERLEEQVAELEAWIDAEFSGWVQDLLAAEGIPARDGDPGAGAPGDDAAAPGGSGGKKKWKAKPDRAAQMPRHRLAARARLRDAAADKAGPRIAELAARVPDKEAAVRRHEKKAQDKISARAAREAAGEKIPGTRPIRSPRQDRDVRAARASLDKARAALEDVIRQALQDAKVNVTDPSSRIMPLKKGGYDQLFNVQALATARTQVILAITRHASPVDTTALEALLAAARAVLQAAGIPGRILKALFDAGYASDANFTLDIPEQLWIALSRTGRTPHGTLPSWQEMQARLDTPEGKELYKQRAATIEPVFAQLTQRLGRTLGFRGSLADAELALWAASHNILKAIGARTRRLARTTPALAA
ncbi:MAG TPA: transposase [Trebonia sp.]